MKRSLSSVPLVLYTANRGQGLRGPESMQTKLAAAAREAAFHGGGRGLSSVSVKSSLLGRNSVLKRERFPRTYPFSRIMFCLVTGACLTGAAFDQLLSGLGVRLLAVRLVLAALAAYSSFFLYMLSWLAGAGQNEPPRSWSDLDPEELPWKELTGAASNVLERTGGAASSASAALLNIAGCFVFFLTAGAALLVIDARFLMTEAAARYAEPRSSTELHWLNFLLRRTWVWLAVLLLGALVFSAGALYWDPAAGSAAAASGFY